MNQLKHALRQLVLRPALSATVIAMLAIGVGATTAIYSLIHFGILQPIAAPDVDELVSFRSPGRKFGTTRGDLVVGGDPQRLFSYPMYRELAAEQSVFTGIAGPLCVPREHGNRRGHDAACERRARVRQLLQRIEP